MLYPGYGQQIDDDAQKMGMFRGLGRGTPPPMGLGPQQPVLPGQKQPMMAAPLDLSVNRGPAVQMQSWQDTKKNWGFGDTKPAVMPSVGGAGVAMPSVGADGLANPGLSTLGAGPETGGGMMSKVGGFLGA